MAGRRAGLAGERSGLFYEFMRLVAEVCPRWVLIENVAGLLSSGERRDMGAVVGSLGQLGYGYAWRVLDAQWFGVPQRRRRVFVVGHLGKPWSAPAKVLFEPEGSPWDSPPRREARVDVARAVARGSSSSGYRYDANGEDFVTYGFSMSSYPLGSEELCKSLTGRHGDPGHVFASGSSYCVRPSTGGVSGKEQQETLVAWQESQSGARLHGSHATLDASNGSRRHQGVFGGEFIRRLTPLECERLQGFPDNWTEGESDSARYRMLGNAVCVPVAEYIGRRIMEAAG